MVGCCVRVLLFTPFETRYAPSLATPRSILILTLPFLVFRPQGNISAEVIEWTRVRSPEHYATQLCGNGRATPVFLSNNAEVRPSSYIYIYICIYTYIFIVIL